MGIIRLLLLLAAGWLALTMFRRWRVQVQRGGQTRLARRGKMVRCAHCGVHVPALEAVTRGGDSFCSEAHKDAHNQQEGG